MRRQTHSRYFSVFLLFILLATCLISQAQENVAISLYPIKENGEWIVEPGQVFKILARDEENNFLTIEANGKTYKNVFEKGIFQVTQRFINSKEFFCFLKTRVEIKGLKYSYDSAEIDYLKSRFLLLKNVCGFFPKHPKFEEIHLLLCKNYNILESYLSEGKIHSESVDLLKEHLKMFPKSKSRDELEWQLACLEGQPWEYEGCPDTALEEAGFFENFLKTHPKSIFVDEINFEIAKAYRIAFHCYDGTPIPISNDKVFDEEKAIICKEKAKNIFKLLLKSTKFFIQEKARLALFGLRKGKKSYNYKNDSEADFQ